MTYLLWNLFSWLADMTTGKLSKYFLYKREENLEKWKISKWR
jgi:hypothetical protein